MTQRKQLCNRLVLALVGNDHLVKQWWNNPNKAFHLRTPNEQWETDAEEVYNYLMHHCYAGGGS